MSASPCGNRRLLRKRCAPPDESAEKVRTRRTERDESCRTRKAVVRAYRKATHCCTQHRAAACSYQFEMRDAIRLRPQQTVREIAVRATKRVWRIERPGTKTARALPAKRASPAAAPAASGADSGQQVLRCRQYGSETSWLRTAALRGNSAEHLAQHAWPPVR